MTNLPSHIPKKGKQIILRDKNYTLATVYDILVEMNACLIKTVTKEQLHAMSAPFEFDQVQEFVIVRSYKTEKEKRLGKAIYMAFANHGLIPYSDGEILDHYKLDQPEFFCNFQLKDIKLLPKNYRFASHYCFSSSNTAYVDWTATLDFDYIFNHFSLAGGDDLAGFAGFYHTS